MLFHSTTIPVLLYKFTVYRRTNASEHPGNSNIRVTKWVKWLEEGGEDDQVTEEQLTASVDGANSFLQPAAPATGTSAPPSAVNTPAVNTPGINTSGSQTPLIAIKPDSSLAPPVPDSAAGEALLQSEQLANAPLKPSPLGVTSESAVQESTPAEAPQVQPELVPVSEISVSQDITVDEQLPSTVPGIGDDGGNMQVEAEQREYDTNMVPELQGAEAETTRTILGQSIQ